MDPECSMTGLLCISPLKSSIQGLVLDWEYSARGEGLSLHHSAIFII